MVKSTYPQNAVVQSSIVLSYVTHDIQFGGAILCYLIGKMGYIDFEGGRGNDQVVIPADHKSKRMLTSVCQLKPWTWLTLIYFPEITVQYCKNGIFYTYKFSGFVDFELLHLFFRLIILSFLTSYVDHTQITLTYYFFLTVWSVKSAKMNIVQKFHFCHNGADPMNFNRAMHKWIWVVRKRKRD